MIFMSLAKVRTHNNIRDFPQAKLNSEINADFLLKGHSDLYFFIS